MWKYIRIKYRIIIEFKSKLISLRNIIIITKIRLGKHLFTNIIKRVEFRYWKDRIINNEESANDKC